MNKPYELYDCTPNDAQHLLLKAALADGDSAIDHWRRWRDNNDLDAIDPASYRLLPMVYRNQLRLDQDDAILKRLKGTYRHTWYKNQIIYRQAEQLLDSWQTQRITPLLLKGAALISRYYGDDGIRYMNDIDFMVPGEQFLSAVETMQDRGWQAAHCSEAQLRYYFKRGFKHGFGLAKNKVEVDVHCQLFRFINQDSDTWQNCRRETWRDRDVYLLNDTDLLYHLCVHGMRWSYAYLTWIPDALVVLNSKLTDIDWPTLLKKARRTRTTLNLLQAFTYLVEEFDAPIPVDVIEQLAREPVSGIERIEFRTLAQKSSYSLRHLMPRIVSLSCRYRHARLNKQGPIAFTPFAWLRFLLTHAALTARTA